MRAIETLKPDTSRVIGRLPEPLLEPIAEERDGYVPNVVYSCGALVHAGRLILPYAMSDQYELCDHAPGRVVKRVEIAAAGQPLMISQR
jgi:predicted GH43/DUF377 family glycosyl hydrolase